METLVTKGNIHLLSFSSLPHPGALSAPPGARSAPPWGTLPTAERCRASDCHGAGTHALTRTWGCGRARGRWALRDSVPSRAGVCSVFWSLSHRHPWGTPSLPRTQLWGLGGPLNPQGSQSHSTFSSQIQKHIHIKFVFSFSQYQKRQIFTVARRVTPCLTRPCAPHTQGWTDGGGGCSRPCPWGKGAVRNPGSSRRHRQPGVTGTGLSLARGGHRPGGAEHGSVASANKDPHSHFLWF